jgi:hypothetical protein
MAATTTQMANAFASGAVFAGNLLPTSVSCSYSSKEALKDCSWVPRTRAGFRTGCCKDDDGHSARPSTRTGSLVKTMMMGLAEEVEEDQRQQHRGDPHGCSSSFANLIKNGALVASLSLALCLGSGQSLIPAFFCIAGISPDMCHVFLCLALLRLPGLRISLEMEFFVKSLACLLLHEFMQWQQQEDCAQEEGWIAKLLQKKKKKKKNALLGFGEAGVDMAMAKRLEGVNKPELLPKEYTTVIDVAGFLSEGQVCLSVTKLFCFFFVFFRVSNRFFSDVFD